MIFDLVHLGLFSNKTRLKWMIHHRPCRETRRSLIRGAFHQAFAFGKNYFLWFGRVQENRECQIPKLLVVASCSLYLYVKTLHTKYHGKQPKLADGGSCGFSSSPLDFGLAPPAPYCIQFSPNNEFPPKSLETLLAHLWWPVHSSCFQTPFFL